MSDGNATPDTMTQGERFVRTLELANLALAVLAVVTVHVSTGPGPLLWGTLVGGAIGVANLRAMVSLGRRLLQSEPGKRRVWGLLFASKLIVLCSLVWLVLAMLPIDSLGFLIGFSTLLPAGLVATFIRSLERTTPSSTVPTTAQPSTPSHGERRP
jgi:hypothetical protein